MLNFATMPINGKPLIKLVNSNGKSKCGSAIKKGYVFQMPQLVQD